MADSLLHPRRRSCRPDFDIMTRRHHHSGHARRSGARTGHCRRQCRGLRTVRNAPQRRAGPAPEVWGLGGASGGRQRAMTRPVSLTAGAAEAGRRLLDDRSLVASKLDRRAIFSGAGPFGAERASGRTWRPQRIGDSSWPPDPRPDPTVRASAERPRILIFAGDRVLFRSAQLVGPSPVLSWQFLTGNWHRACQLSECFCGSQLPPLPFS
jgi:hypothetical protein